MDRSIDPCVDLYHYSCGGWQKKNPIPPDQTSWSVYGKLYVDNLNFLRTILEQAASTSAARTPVTQKIGDFYAACMDESAVEKRGLSPIQTELDSIAKLNSPADIARLIARLQLTYGGSIVFGSGSSLDPDNSEEQIAQIDQGRLGLPDRDYYTKEDDKSKETRQRYVEHVQRIFELAGDNRETAKANADTVMGLRLCWRRHRLPAWSVEIPTI
jgi:putative endopeptidase